MGTPIRVSVVLPAHNEEGNIGIAIDSCRSVVRRLADAYEIVVVNDGSTDRTADIVSSAAATDPNVRLVSHERNRGYGQALRTGFRSAGLDLVLLTDADNQFDPRELELMLPLIENADVVCGYRMKRQDPLLRRLFGKAWNVLVRALFYVPVRDVDCAFKLFRRSVFERIELESNGAMVSTELMVKLARSGAGIVEVGVTHLPRSTGSPSGANPSVVARAFRELWAMRSRLRTVEASSFASDEASSPDG